MPIGELEDPTATRMIEKWLETRGPLRVVEGFCTFETLDTVTRDPRVSPFLTRVHLYYNHDMDITPLLPALERLPNLIELDIHDNRIPDEAAFIANLGRLTRLKKLDVCMMSFKKPAIWPRALAPLTQLTELNLRQSFLSAYDYDSDNRGRIFSPVVAELFEALQHLRQLVHLNLQMNCDIDDLEPLATLLPANGGSLKTLDVQLCMGLLDRFQLDRAVLEITDAAAVFEALRLAKTRRRAPLPLVKGMILGDGGTGKTHLRHRLMKRNPQAAAIASTPSFEIERTSIVKCDGTAGDIELRLFDFGGQPYLQGAHRLFLASERNFYIVMCRGDLSPEATHLPYWLRMVRYCGGTGMPVIVIRSWADKSLHADWKQWHAQRIATEFDLTCIYIEDYADPPGNSPLSFNRQKLADIYSAIEQIVASMGSALAARYDLGMLEIKRWLEGEPSSVSPEKFAGGYITRDVFDKACRRAGAESPTEIATWLMLLSHLGFVTYLGDLPETADPSCRELREYLFDPNWLRHPLYALVTPSEWTSHLQFPGGIVPTERVENLLQERGSTHHAMSREEVRLLVAVARTTRLLFDAKAATGLTNAYLIVDLLPDEPVCVPLESGGWELVDIAQLRFLSDTYLPRLVGEMQEYLKSLASSTFRSWVILRFLDVPGVEALVKVDLNLAKAEFYAKGADAHSRLHCVRQVRNDFLEIAVRDNQKIDLATSSVSEATSTLASEGLWSLIYDAIKDMFGPSSLSEFRKAVETSPAQKSKLLRKIVGIMQSHDATLVDRGSLGRGAHIRVIKSKAIAVLGKSAVLKEIAGVAFRNEPPLMEVADKDGNMVYLCPKCGAVNEPDENRVQSRPEKCEACGLPFPNAMKREKRPVAGILTCSACGINFVEASPEGERWTSVPRQKGMCPKHGNIRLAKEA